ncbi:MAG: hypothetical protein WBP47_13250, partial [Candidatus Promineifilaceae bacterium]
MHKYARLGFVIFAFIWLTACQTAVSQTPTAPAAATTRLVATAQPLVTSTAPPPTQTPTATPPPRPTPTPAPLTVGFATAVPAELRTAVTAILQEHPDQFALTEANADLMLAVQEETPIGEWIFAIAAPFPTFADDITLADAQAAWLNGDLVLTAAMETILRDWWGSPASEPTIVAPEQLIDTLWRTQTSYDKPVLTIVPFEQLDPRLKVLAVDG